MLRKIHEICSKPYLVLPLVGIFTFVSCRKEKIVSDVATQRASEQIQSMNSGGNPSILAKNAANYSGEDVFRGVIFVQGHFAKEIRDYDQAIKDLNRMNLNARQEQEKMANEIVDSIKHRDTSYFTRFRAEMASHDYYRIDNAVKGAMQLVVNIGQNTSFKAYFKIGKEIVQEANVEIAKYDMTTSEGIARFQKDLEVKAQDKIEADIGGGAGVLYLPILVFAAFIWEVFFIVNFIFIGTWLAILWAKFLLWPDARKGGDALTGELVIADIADAL